MSRLRRSVLLLPTMLLASAVARPAYPAAAPAPVSVERDAARAAVGASADRTILTDPGPFRSEGLLDGTGASLEILAGGEGMLGRTVARALRALGSGVRLDVASGPAASRAFAARRSALDFTAALAAARSGIISSGSTAPPPPSF